MLQAVVSDFNSKSISIKNCAKDLKFDALEIDEKDCDIGKNESEAGDKFHDPIEYVEPNESIYDSTDA